MGQGYADQIPSDVFSLDDLKAKRATAEVEQNPFSPLLSGALGFANAASFGLASQVASKSGLVEQETLSALKNVNPVSYTAGELASFVVPATPLVKGSGLIAKSLRTASRFKSRGRTARLLSWSSRTDSLLRNTSGSTRSWKDGSVINARYEDPFARSRPRGAEPSTHRFLLTIKCLLDHFKEVRIRS